VLIKAMTIAEAAHKVGAAVKGDGRRGTGICPNVVMRGDDSIGDGCLTDPIGGSASFYDTMVNVVKAKAYAI